jgi:hypothetical protein
VTFLFPPPPLSLPRAKIGEKSAEKQPGNAVRRLTTILHQQCRDLDQQLLWVVSKSAGRALYKVRLDKLAKRASLARGVWAAGIEMINKISVGATADYFQVALANGRWCGHRSTRTPQPSRGH